MDTLPDSVAAYCRWHKAAYGWHPFEALECKECGQPVALIEVYRCYDCGLPMHRDCCRRHCQQHGTDTRNAHVTAPSSDFEKVPGYLARATRIGEVWEYAPEAPDLLDEKGRSWFNPMLRYRHKKTQGVYLVLAHGLIEKTLEHVVVYMGVRGGPVWVRPVSEWIDGRFEVAERKCPKSSTS